MSYPGLLKAAAVSVSLTALVFYALGSSSHDRSIELSPQRPLVVPNSAQLSTEDLLRQHDQLLAPAPSDPLPRFAIVYLYVNGSDPVVAFSRFVAGGSKRGATCLDPIPLEIVASVHADIRS
jgi:hypothetical protein